MSRILTAIIAILAIATTIVGLAGCSGEEARLRAQSEMYHAQAAAIRAEGDAALVKAQAYDMTVRTQADARLLALADRQNDIIDNTYWLNWLVFILLILVLVLLGLQVWILTEIRRNDALPRNLRVDYGQIAAHRQAQNAYAATEEN